MSGQLKTTVDCSTGMKTDTEIRIDGTNALIDALGEIQAERYITLMTREKFDYTKWQRNLWMSRSIESISKSAMRSRKKVARKT